VEEEYIMTEFVISWIMWAIVASTNPNVNIIVVLDEFPRQDTCLKIAEEVAVSAAADIEERKIPAIESVTAVCIPVLTRESEDTLLKDKPKKHLRTEPIG